MTIGVFKLSKRQEVDAYLKGAVITYKVIKSFINPSTNKNVFIRFVNCITGQPRVCYIFNPFLTWSHSKEGPILGPASRSMDINRVHSYPFNITAYHDVDICTYQLKGLREHIDSIL
jgi:hypothetical protein